MNNNGSNFDVADQRTLELNTLIKEQRYDEAAKFIEFYMKGYKICLFADTSHLINR